MAYSVVIHRPFQGDDYVSADTRAEAQQIARAERERDPRVTVTIERIGR